MTTLLFSSVTITAEEVKVDYGELKEDYEPSYPLSESYPTTSIPLYDPRLTNGITSAKNQSGGTCSIFTTVSMMERSSYVQTGLKHIYSEEAMTWILSKRLAEFNGLPSEYPGYYCRDYDEPSSIFRSSAYITNRNNPIINYNSVSWLAPNYES